MICCGAAGLACQSDHVPLPLHDQVFDLSAVEGAGTVARAIVGSARIYQGIGAIAAVGGDKMVLWAVIIDGLHFAAGGVEVDAHEQYAPVILV